MRNSIYGWYESNGTHLHIHGRHSPHCGLSAQEHAKIFYSCRTVLHSAGLSPYPDGASHNGIVAETSGTR